MTATSDSHVTGEGDAAVLAQILLSLSVGKSTGVLHVAGAGWRRHLYFFEGAACSVQSDAREDQLGPLLVRIGWMSPETWQNIAARTGRNNPTTGEVAVAIRPGDLPEGQSLRDVLRLHLQILGATCFGSPVVAYEFDPFPPDLPTSAGLEIEPLGMVADGFFSHVPDAVIDGILPSLGEQPLAPTEVLSHLAPFLIEFFGQDAVADVVTRPRSASEIVATSADPRVARRLVAVLIATGALSVAPSSALEPEAATSADPLGTGLVMEAVPISVEELQTLATQNHFDLLGVSESADADAVKEAAKALLARLDIKLYGQAVPELRDGAGKLANRVREAQITLLHPEVRRQYIASLGSVGQGRAEPQAAAAVILSGPRQEIEALLAEAKQLEGIQDWEKARELVAKAIDVAPKESDLHARMGWYTYKCSSIEHTERERLFKHHLEYALELNPNEILAHHYFGVIYTNQGNPVRARMEFQAALKIDPTFKPSKDALERLGKPPKEALQQQAVRPSAYKSPLTSRSKLGGLIALLIFLLIPLAISRLYADDAGPKDFTPEEFDSQLKFLSAYKQNQTLVIVVSNWDEIQDKERELVKIGSKAADLGKGLEEVMVFAPTGLVGQYEKKTATVLK